MCRCVRQSAGHWHCWLLPYWTECRSYVATTVFTTRRKASFASAVYATAYQSVVCPSVRLSVRYTPVLCLNESTQMDAVFAIETLVSSFLMPRIVDGGRPCPGKIWVQRGRPPCRPPCENSRAVYISPHNSATVIDNEKSLINILHAARCAVSDSRPSCDPVTRVGSTGAGPQQNNWTVHVKKSRKTKWQPCVPWRLEQTAESHSLLSRLSRAWPPSRCTSGPRLQSVY